VPVFAGVLAEVLLIRCPAPVIAATSNAAIVYVVNLMLHILLTFGWLYVGVSTLAW